MDNINDLEWYRKGNGKLWSLEERRKTKDKPLSLNWRNGGNGHIFNIEYERMKLTPNQLIVAKQILNQAFLEKQGLDNSISVSLNRNHYTGKAQYFGKKYTYNNIAPTIKALDKAGFIELQTALNKGPTGSQSTYRATDLLMSSHSDETNLRYHPIQLVRIKDKNKNLVNYRETAFTENTRRLAQNHNEGLRSIDIDFIAHPNIERRGPFLVINTSKEISQIINTAHDQLHAVFNNGTVTDGGRLYGHHIQQLPAEYRNQVTINGNSTREKDYDCLHAQLLYACAGKKLEGDAYDIQSGFKRRAVKVAFNILLNAKTELGALQAIRRDNLPGVTSSKDAQNLVAAIKRHHKPVAGLFHSCIGIKLQRIDSDIMREVIAEMLKLGSVIIPIHDSARVEEKYFAALSERMDIALDKSLKNLRNKAIA